MSTNIFTSMAGGAIQAAFVTQTGFAVLNFAPVALKAPAMGAIAAGGAAMGAVDYYRDRADTNASRRTAAQNDPSTDGLSRLLHTLQRRETQFNVLRNIVMHGAVAAAGSAAFGLAGVQGVLPVGLAFGAGAVGFSAIVVGCVLAAVTLCWLQPTAGRAA